MHGLMGGWKRKRPGHGHHGWDDLAGNRGNADPVTYHRMTPTRLPPTLLRYGHSAERLSKSKHYVRMRLALFIGKRRRRSRHYGNRALLGFTKLILQPGIVM
jgi:hypothetical protein